MKIPIEILVDEHIPLMTVQALRSMNHDVRDIRGTPDQGMHDDVLWESAQREGQGLSGKLRIAGVCKGLGRG